MRTGTHFLVVHYRGGGPALQDLLAGYVDLMTNQVAVSSPYILEGTLRVYAVLADRRLPQTPQLPIADEAGFRLPRRQLERAVGTQGNAARGGRAAQCRGGEDHG